MNIEENHLGIPDSLQKNRHRIVHHDGSERAAHHDNKSSELHDRAEMPALEHLTAKNGAKRHHDSDNGQKVHAPVTSLLWPYCPFRRP